MRGRSSISSPKRPSPDSHAPADPSASPLLSSAYLADRLQADLASLDQLEHAWLPLALRGNAGAADRILAIQRQRAAILQLALQAAAQAEQHALAEKAATGEQRIVVEYVDDWRQVRQPEVPFEVRHTSSNPPR